MNELTATKLHILNRQFYQTFAASFSSTRKRIQPGVQKIIDGMTLPSAILDLGCGNGYLASELVRRGYDCTYTGLDSSQELLGIARQSCPPAGHIFFLHADLVEAGWHAVLDTLPDGWGSPPFDVIFSFAFLHHVPGAGTRLEILRQIHSLLAPNGLFVHSEWQFLNNPRMRSRIQDWDTIGLSSQDIDRGDYLLDWRHGGLGLRYVHEFNEEELAHMASDTQFSIRSTFYSDGEGGKQSIYQSWQPMHRTKWEYPASRRSSSMLP